MLIKLISYTCPKFNLTLLLEFKMISKVKKIEIISFKKHLGIVKFIVLNILKTFLN